MSRLISTSKRHLAISRGHIAYCSQHCLTGCPTGLPLNMLKSSFLANSIYQTFPQAGMLTVLCPAARNAREFICLCPQGLPGENTYIKGGLELWQIHYPHLHQLNMQIFTFFAVLVSLVSTSLAHIYAVSGPSTYAATSSSTYPLTFSTSNGPITKCASFNTTFASLTRLISFWSVVMIFQWCQGCSLPPLRMPHLPLERS